MQLVSTFLLMGVMLDCLERLVSRRLYASDGMFSWSANRLDYAAGSQILRSFDGLFDHLQFSYFVLIEFVSAAAALWFGSPYSAYFIAIIILIRGLSIVRNGHYGSEGADHMLLVLLGSVVVYAVAPGVLAKRAVLWFICAETLLAYVTAGIIKLRHRKWREGAAIRNVLATELFGHRGFERSLSMHPWLSPIICWSVIVFECASPVLVLTSYKGCVIFILAGLCFHLGIAVTQGLNLFVWVFFATYPALLVTSHDVSRYLFGSS